ncbi:hypothetical protein HZA86_01995 [Candidatus Uhrbacteria bacterium]|nr:hypothetical protein [Candidatus Uhrbacteria bacterium]
MIEPTDPARLPNKATARLRRKALRAHRRVGKIRIRLTGADIQRLTGITVRQLAAWKRQGHIDTAVPRRVSNDRKTAAKAIQIIRFTDLITAKIIRFLLGLGLGERIIFEACDDRPRSRGLYTRCDLTLRQRHGHLGNWALVIRNNGEFDVSITRDWPIGRKPQPGTHVLDFRSVVPELLAAISELKGRTIESGAAIVDPPRESPAANK